MKLQKLVYYSQAWSLVWDERPIFDEPIEAWAGGPVVRTLFNAHQGEFIVDKEPRGNAEALDQAARETIDAILNAYGDKTGNGSATSPTASSRGRPRVLVLRMGRAERERSLLPPWRTSTRTFSLMGRKNGGKNPRYAANVGQPKTVRQSEGLGPLGVKKAKTGDPAISGSPLAWRFSGKDSGGPFSWSVLADGGKYKAVCERLHEFETKSWSEILESGCHPIEVSRLSKDAKARLAEIERDDLDELMSFRIQGAERVWAVQERNIMRVLWWDPTHQVYPTPKDKADRIKLKNRA